jgi:23S rRNA (adenine2503-C2)-methyltransferase
MPNDGHSQLFDPSDFGVTLTPTLPTLSSENAKRRSDWCADASRDTGCQLMRILDLRHRLRALGANPAHEQHVLRRWAQAKSQDSGRRRIDNYLPLAVRNALPELTDDLASLARLHSEHPAADGSSRLLIALHDGQTVEAVRLPRSEGLCVSSQVGCAVGCTFCMTGTMGLVRQLGGAEIVAQVALARQQRAVHKVVFMGMGEPAHNLDNVMEAIVFDRLPQGTVKPALALSLHTTNDARRTQLLPRAPRITVAELTECGEQYACATGYPIQYQWTLLAGINDGDDEIEGIVSLLKGKYAILNMIPYNRVEGFDLERPSAERCTDIFRRLNQRGVLTRLRQSAGQDVNAGCGQLRSRVIALRAA